MLRRQSSRVLLICVVFLIRSIFGQVARREIKLGFDNFSVRALDWKAPQLIDYASHLAVDSLFITDLDAFDADAVDRVYLDGAPAIALRLRVLTSIYSDQNGFVDTDGAVQIDNLQVTISQDGHPDLDRIMRDTVARVLDQVTLLRSIAGEFSLLGRPRDVETGPLDLPELVVEVVAGYGQPGAGVGPRSSWPPRSWSWCRGPSGTTSSSRPSFPCPPPAP